jgi:hypothetical protein
VGVVTGIIAINAELELGATKADSRFLQEANSCLRLHRISWNWIRIDNNQLDD